MARRGLDPGSTRPAPRGGAPGVAVALLGAALFALPSVAEATDVPALTGALALGSIAVRMVLFAWLVPRLARSPLGSLLGLAHDLAVMCFLVVASGDPMTPLFAASTIYAGFDGVDPRLPRQATRTALHVVAPLATIPFFLGAHDAGTAIGGPVFFAVSAAIAYEYTAVRKTSVHAALKERNALRARLAEHQVAAESERMISQLVDSVSARMHRAAARAAVDPAPDGTPIAAAARSGLAELRATLDALVVERAERPATRAASRVYQRWPEIPRAMIWELGSRDLQLTIGLSLAMAIALAIPSVADALGITSWIAVPIVLLFPLWAYVRDRAGFARSERASVRAADYLATCGLGASISVALPAATGDPSTPVWSLAIMYAMFNADEHEIHPSVPVLLAHALAPVATIPVFLALGAPTAPAVSMPLVLSALCAAAHHRVALASRAARDTRTERDALAAQLAEVHAERARERIARDLHDTAGASLSLAAVYADLMGQRRGDPAGQRALEEAMTAAAEQGLEDLRAMLEGLAPEAIDLDGVAGLIEARVGRLAGATGVRIDLVRGSAASISHAAGYALLRIAQEAVANAVRHARPRVVRIELGREGTHALLRVADDGPGFDPAAVTRGRGLGNMRRRAEELGGSLRVESGASGTTVVARIALA